MYRIIGTDGREYGPVSRETLAQWIGEGRANGQTRAQAEGTTEWKTLAEFAEFANALTAKPQAALPISGGAAEAEAIAAEILARDYHVDIGRCLSRAWELVKRNFWLTVGATFLITLLTTVLGSIPLLGLLASLVFQYVLFGGLDWLFLKLVRGQRAELGDAFAGFGVAFVPLMLLSLVGQLLMGVGFLLCILPGIYLMVAWLPFTALLIMDKRLEFWPAMELSRKVITRHWWQMFALFLVGLLLLFAGLLACLVGVFIALPVVTCAIVYAYEDIFGAKAAHSAAAVEQVKTNPSTPPNT